VAAVVPVEQEADKQVLAVVLVVVVHMVVALVVQEHLDKEPLVVQVLLRLVLTEQAVAVELQLLEVMVLHRMVVVVLAVTDLIGKVSEHIMVAAVAAVC
jgi:hypothetical protein